MAESIPKGYITFDDYLQVVTWAPVEIDTLSSRKYRNDFFWKEIDSYGLIWRNWYDFPQTLLCPNLLLKPLIRDGVVFTAVYAGPADSRERIELPTEFLKKMCPQFFKNAINNDPTDTNSPPFIYFDDVQPSIIELFKYFLILVEIDVVRDEDDRDHLDLIEYVKFYEFARQTEWSELQNIIAEYIWAYIHDTKVQASPIVKLINYTHRFYIDRENEPLLKLSVDCALFFITYAEPEETNSMLLDMSPQARIAVLGGLKKCVVQTWTSPISQEEDVWPVDTKFHILEVERNPLGSRKDYFI